jgi:hypothetical protein
MSAKKCNGEQPMRDGLYQVDRYGISAGFVIKNGVVTQCAPILRKKLAYWMTIAIRICDL